MFVCRMTSVYMSREKWGYKKAFPLIHLVRGYYVTYPGSPGTHIVGPWLIDSMNLYRDLRSGTQYIGNWASGAIAHILNATEPQSTCRKSAPLHPSRMNLCAATVGTESPVVAIWGLCGLSSYSGEEYYLQHKFLLSDTSVQQLVVL